MRHSDIAQLDVRGVLPHGNDDKGYSAKGSEETNGAPHPERERHGIPLAEEAPNRAGDSPEICQNDKAKDEDPYPVQEQAYRHSALRNPVMITFHQIGRVPARIAGDRAQAIRLKPNSDHRMISASPRTLDLWTMRRRPECGELQKCSVAGAS